MSDPKDPDPPSADEFSKQLAEFMKKNLGGNVSFAGFPGMGSEGDLSTVEEDESDDSVETKRDIDIFGFDYRPRDIKAHLDRFVIRQDDARHDRATSAVHKGQAGTTLARSLCQGCQRSL